MHMGRRRHLAAIVIAAAMLVAACTGGGDGSTSTTSASVSGAGGAAGSGSAVPTSPAASETPDTTEPDPDEAAMQNPGAVPGVATNDDDVARAIDQVDTVAQTTFDKSGVPGMAVAVVHGGKTVFAKGYGVREVGRPEAVDTDTAFQLASLSKPIGATVVAKEVGAGTVAWTTPLADHLPGFRLADPYATQNVTIADMYSHRSGLPNHAGDDLEDLGYDQQQILDRLKYLPLNPFRAVYNYTNYGLTAAAVSVAAAAGTDWSTLSERDIYGPLGMTHTSSDFAGFAANPNHAAGHVPVDGGYQATYVRDPDGQSPAGGVSASVTDVATWLAMVMSGGKAADGSQLVEPEALRAAMTPVMRAADGSPTPPQIDARSGFYGYGFGITNDASGRVRIAHSGAFSAGAGTTVMYIPDLDLGIVVLTNAVANGSAEAITHEFADTAEFGSVQQDWYSIYRAGLAGVTAPTGELVGQTPPADPAPASPNAAYVGSYQNDYFGPITVSESGGGLVLTAGPKNQQFPLSHWDGQTFTLNPAGLRGSEPGGENVDDGSISAVTFAGAGDTASSVTVEAWNRNGLGTFTR